MKITTKFKLVFQISFSNLHLHQQPIKFLPSISKMIKKLSLHLPSLHHKSNRIIMLPKTFQFRSEKAQQEPSTTNNQSRNYKTTTTSDTKSSSFSSSKPSSQHSKPSSSSSNNELSNYLKSIQCTHPIVDIGINLTNHQFKQIIPHVLQRSKQSNVTGLILTGTSVKSSELALDLIEQYNSSSNGVVELYGTVGVHPHDAKSCNDSTIGQMMKLIERGGDRMVMIGECGLDYNRMFSPKQVQVDWFKEQLRLAMKLKMPIFCHERDAHDDFIKCIQEVCLEHPNQQLPPLVVHCFTGTELHVQKYVEMGFYIGFTGTICMKERGATLRQILSKNIIPYDRIMIETDGPFMMPPLPKHVQSHFQSGAGAATHNKRPMQRCEPCLLPLIVDTMVECGVKKGNHVMTRSELEAQFTLNTERFVGRKLLK